MSGPTQTAVRTNDGSVSIKENRAGGVSSGEISLGSLMHTTQHAKVLMCDWTRSVGLCWCISRTANKAAQLISDSFITS